MCGFSHTAIDSSHVWTNALLKLSLKIILCGLFTSHLGPHTCLDIISLLSPGMSTVHVYGWSPTK